MPRRKVVPRLKRLTKGRLSNMCYQIVQRILSQVSWNKSELTGEEASLVVGNEELLNKLIAEIRKYLVEGLPKDLAEYICFTWLSVLSLVIKSYEQVPSQPISLKTELIFVTARLAEIGVWGGLTKLDLVKVSKQIRSSLYSRIGELPRLQFLNLSPGIGNGWLSQRYLNHFYEGVKSLRNLIVFRFQNDCTNQVLVEVLRNCGHSLRVVDLQFSRLVDDESLDAFLTFCPSNHLEELSLSGTGIGYQSTLRLLEHFSCLKRISIEDQDVVFRHLSNTNLTLSSLQYLGSGSSEDLSLEMPCHSLCVLSKICPSLRTLTVDLRVIRAPREALSGFRSIHDLTILGGDLAEESTHEAIHLCGGQLTALTLVHTENVSFHSLLRLSKHCERLNALSLVNCSLSSHTYAQTEPPPFPWHALERLTLQFPCDHETLIYLLLLCPNLRELQLGISTQFSDETISEVLAISPWSLRKLQVFKVAHSDLVTMCGVFHLIHHCPGLYALQDLSSCSQITAKQVSSLRTWTREHNLLLNAE